MPTIQDYLFATGQRPGVWVGLVNNTTSIAYVSSAATDGTGLFSITAPAGIYTFYTSNTGTGTPPGSGWTPTGDTGYVVGPSPLTVILAVGGCRTVTDAGITSGAAVLTSATAAFTAADVGKTVAIRGAGALASPTLGGYSSTIITFTNSTTVTLGLNATTTVSNALAIIGPDDTSIIQAACSTAGQKRLLTGTYLITARVDLAAGCWLIGDTDPKATSLYLAGGNWDDAMLNLNGSGARVESLTCGMIGPNRRGTNGAVIRPQATEQRVMSCQVSVPDLGYSSSSVGIEAKANASDAYVMFNRVIGTIADGIYQANNDGCRIIGNDVSNSGDDGISVHGGDGAGPDTTNCTVALNYVHNSGGGGIFVGGGKRVKVVDNEIDGTFTSGIRVFGGLGFTQANWIDVRGNTIRNAGLAARPTYGGLAVPSGYADGIDVSWDTTPVSIIDITQNTIVAPKRAYINCFNFTNATTGSYVNIRGNTCVNLDGSALSTGQSDAITPPPGIYVEKLTGHVDISNNTMYTALAEGVRAATTVTANLKVDDNKFDLLNNGVSATIAAIRLNGTGVADVRGNSLLDTSSHITNFADLTGQAVRSQVLDNITLGLPVIGAVGVATSTLTNVSMAGVLKNVISAGATAIADDFLGTTLAAAWVAEATAALSTSVANSVLAIGPGASTGHRLRTYTPSGALAVESLVASWPSGSSMGLMVRDNGTGDASGQAMILIATSSQIQFYSLDTGVYTLRGAAGTQPTTQWMYLKLTRDGSNQWNGYYSMDRVNWVQVGTANYAKTFTVNKAGFRFSGNAASTDFFDVTT